ncbi:MAG: ABC transporter ATP-binding protein [Deinococcaceae bacterium]
MPFLELRGVSYQYHRGAFALQNLDLSVEQGQLVCVLGPSGSGKSTLLSLLAGFLHPDQGNIYLAGQVLRQPSMGQTLVQQEHALFPWRTVLGNVAFGLERRKGNSASRTQRSHEVLGWVGLEGFETRRIHELSGGQRQRVALARALAIDPMLLLLDEPFSALDALGREKICDDLLSLWQRTQKTIIFVTHNLDEALHLGQRILVFNKGKVVLDRLGKHLGEQDLRNALL